MYSSTLSLTSVLHVDVCSTPRPGCFVSKKKKPGVYRRRIIQDVLRLHEVQLERKWHYEL
jgi:hypothetical protein